MNEDPTRIVTYEEVVEISAAGNKKNVLFNPVIRDCTIYVDIIGKVVTSTVAMMTYCRNNDIPFIIAGDDLLTIRVVTMRDTKAEQEASAYMLDKYSDWDGDWTVEFIGFVVGWRRAMQQDPKLAALIYQGK